MEFYVLDPDTQFAGEIERLRKEGKHPLCPVCKAELIVVLSPEEARLLKLHP